MEMLQRKLAESEVKRAEAVKQLKSLSVSEAYEGVVRYCSPHGQIQYNQLKGQHYNLTQVGIELITTLEKTIRGESVSKLIMLLNICALLLHPFHFRLLQNTF